MKVLELLKDRIGDVFEGVITGITSFGIFVQVREYLIDGLIRYEDLMDDWWDVDERSGVIRGQRTGVKIGIGDLASVLIVRVDVARRELDLAIRELLGRGVNRSLLQGRRNQARSRRRKRGDCSAAQRQAGAVAGADWRLFLGRDYTGFGAARRGRILQLVRRFRETAGRGGTSAV